MSHFLYSGSVHSVPTLPVSVSGISETNSKSHIFRFILMHSFWCRKGSKSLSLCLSLFTVNLLQLVNSCYDIMHLCCHLRERASSIITSSSYPFVDNAIFSFSLIKSKIGADKAGLFWPEDVWRKKKLRKM